MRVALPSLPASPWRLLIVLLGLVACAWLLQAAGQWLGLPILTWQRELHRLLTLSITNLSDAPSPATWATLLGISFGYGVFHAAGPGHGKAVLSTYLLTQGSALKRALLLSSAAALMQALVAIGLIAVLVQGLGWLTREALSSVIWVERASFLVVVLLGLWLCWRAWRQLARQPHGHAPAPEPQAHGHHSHHAGHGHDCGCAHHVAPGQGTDLRAALGTVIGIGMRPCSGAVLLIGAASLLGHFWAGVLAVLAMAVGTALTVSTLAILSVMARGWAQGYLARSGRFEHVSRLLAWLALAGGLIIVVLGLTLLMARDRKSVV